jgi:hypothetical protein
MACVLSMGSRVRGSDGNCEGNCEGNCDGNGNGDGDGDGKGGGGSLIHWIGGKLSASRGGRTLANCQTPSSARCSATVAAAARERAGRKAGSGLIGIAVNLGPVPPACMI